MVFSTNGTLINVILQSVAYPWQCAVTSASLLVVDSANVPGDIVFYNPATGSMTSVVESIISSGYGSETLGMAISPDGRIFVAALSLGIYVFSSAGAYQGLISSPAEDIYSYSMAYTTANNGQLYVVDLFNNRIVTFPVGYNGSPSKSGSSRTVTGQASSALIATAAIILALLVFV